MSGDIGVVVRVDESQETYRGGCLDGSCCCVLLADDLGFLMPVVLMKKAACAELTLTSPWEILHFLKDLMQDASTT